MLTQKQENFTLNLFKGMSQRDAYINAGYSDTQLPATLDRNAFNMANNNKIITRLAELNKPIISKTIADVNERKEILSSILRDKSRSAVQAADTLNKMEKLYTDGPTINVALIKEVEVRLS